MYISKYKPIKGKRKPVILAKDGGFNIGGDGKISDPADIYRMFAEIGVCEDTEERFWMISLNGSSRIKGIFELSHGNAYSTTVNPRGMAQRMLLGDAVEIITVHNHPSGDCLPSNDDIGVCKKIARLCELLDVGFADNIIVGGEEYFSFRQFGMMDECKRQGRIEMKRDILKRMG